MDNRTGIFLIKVALRSALVTLIVATVVQIAIAQREADSNSPRFKAVLALQEMIESQGDQPLRTFIKEKMSPAITNANLEEDLMEMLRRVRRDFGNSLFEGAMPKGPYTAIMIFAVADGGQPSRLMFEIEAEAPHRFVYLDY